MHLCGFGDEHIGFSVSVQ